MLDIDSIKVGDWVTFPSAEDGAWYQVTEIEGTKRKFFIDKKDDPHAFLWEISITGIKTGSLCAACEERIDVVWPDVDYLCKRCRATV